MSIAMEPRTDDAALGVPDGVLALASALLPSADVARMLNAPRRLEPDWPDPAPPLPVGQGWVHAAVVDDDLDTMTALLADDQHGSGPEALAATAQQLRLPVTPYRPLGHPHHPAGDGVTHGHIPAAKPDVSASIVDPVPELDRTVAQGAVVVDLTTHWAGPLATRLLAESGATVIKIDPDCRPDGFRARAGLYRDLNGGKEIVDLDLRSPADRGRFERLITEADLVVESFSRRVMTNLGYGPSDLRTINRSVATLAVRAFPAGTPESDWVGYGPGVHAVSGLAMTTGQPRTAALAYPDFLAGLLGHRLALLLLADPDRPPATEVSLLGAMAPLVARARTIADPVDISEGDHRGSDR